MQTYEILSLSPVTGTNIYCNLICKPPLSDIEIDELKKRDYSYATDGHSHIYTIIYSEKETSSLGEIDSILKKYRWKKHGEQINQHVD